MSSHEITTLLMIMSILVTYLMPLVTVFFAVDISRRVTTGDHIIPAPISNGFVMSCIAQSLYKLYLSANYFSLLVFSGLVTLTINRYLATHDILEQIWWSRLFRDLFARQFATQNAYVTRIVNDISADYDRMLEQKEDEFDVRAATENGRRVRIQHVDDMEESDEDSGEAYDQEMEKIRRLSRRQRDEGWVMVDM